MILAICIPKKNFGGADCRSHRCIGTERIQQRSCGWKIVLCLKLFKALHLIAFQAIIF